MTSSNSFWFCTRVDQSAVAQLAGVSEEVTRALWRAMGFADVGGEAEFTMADVEALRALMAPSGCGLCLVRGIDRVGPAIGQHTSRLAEWQETSSPAH